MRYFIIALFFLVSCGSGSSDPGQFANINATDSANVVVDLAGGDSDDDSQFDHDDPDIQDVLSKCRVCCLDGVIGQECIDGFRVSCAPEDFVGTECES